MLSKTYSYGTTGLSAYPIIIEVDVTRGLPSMSIVGLPDSAVKESRQRIRSAILNSGYAFQAKRVTINLAPADTKKEGPSFDLAMAIGYLAATGQIPEDGLNDYIFLGELSLDGKVRPMHGALSIALNIPKNKFKGLVLPSANAPEASMTENIPIYPIKSLNDCIHFLSSEDRPSSFKTNRNSLPKSNHYSVDFSDVKGQYYVKRGLEVAAAGGHNILLIGPPGSGKSMLSQRLLSILPTLTLNEALEVTQIHSIVGLVDPSVGIIQHRPFRSPHHTSSHISLVGGGPNPRPGEISLAHHGVLFLDELPEFPRHVLESLRQPLEDGHVTVARAAQTLRFPSRFMFVGAMNPCPCGKFGSPRLVCHCSSTQVQRYRSKISGPLLDRIDIHLDVPTVNYLELRNTQPAESSEEIKKRVIQGRSIQTARFKRNNETINNAQMTHKQIEQYCPLGKEESDLLKQAMKELNLSARAHDKILKVARTIADLAGSNDINVDHLAEAIQYRSLDRDW